MIKENGIVQALTWVKQFLLSSISIRKKHFQICLNGILNRTGKVKDENKFLVELIKNNEVIGMATNINYLLVDGDSEESKYIYVHPFSTPTILVKMKNIPCLILVNPNLDYNNSMLHRIEYNKYVELLNDMKSLKGISG